MTRRHTVAATFMVLLAAAAARGDTVDDYLKQATEALVRKDVKAALELYGKAMAADPKDARAAFHRGELHEGLRKFDAAFADFDEAIRRDPKHIDAYNHRGSVQFQRGHVAESLADFDTFLKLKPAAFVDHWKRGISLYYLGKYEEGAKQFHAGEKVYADDVENAVWHFLCVARKEGVDKAREKILKIGKDQRVAMMEVYGLFQGKLEPADVMTAAEAGKATDAERHERLFYAHLYLGLYYDAVGDRKKAEEHGELAVGKYGMKDYMGDVARVQLQHLKKGSKTPK